MEPTQISGRSDKPLEEDIDLGQFFNKTGGAINNFFSFLGRLFEKMGEMLLLLVFFLRRNLLWLAIGTAVGMAYGIFLYMKGGDKYSSTMVVRANFGSSRNLYGSMDMFNALANNGQVGELTRILKITPDEARSLSQFDAKPVTSEILTADMYKENFLKTLRNAQIRLDTFWIRAVKYEDFKSSLTKYDYPIQEITVISNNPGIFSKIQQGIIDQVSSNLFLQASKNSDAQNNQETIGMLTRSIQSLDTLRASYAKRLVSTPVSNTPSGGSVTMLDGTMALHSPELDLYDKLLQLKDELKTTKSAAVTENEILQVYSGFSLVGQKISFLKQHIAYNALMGLYLSLAIILLLGLYRSLRKIEKQYSIKHARLPA